MAHAIPGRRPVAEALRAGRTIMELLVDARGGAEIGALADAAQGAGVPVRRVERSALDAATGGVLHQGVAALAPPFPYRGLDELGDVDLAVVLDGITDPHNLGAIARSAEAAGAQALVIRRRRGAGVTPAAEKTSAGALSWLPVVAVANLVNTLEHFGRRGLWSVGLAGDGDEDLFACGLLDGPITVVIGSESSGLSRLTAERVDTLVRVPMSGQIASLNASAAAAVALFEVRRRRVGD